MKTLFSTVTSLSLLSLSVLAVAATGANAHDHDGCAAGKTLEDGVLTIATGNPAFYPWVLNDDPASGEGYEAAVAYAIADAMGFDADHVTWVRTSFDEAIQPGSKDFDFNMQQYSITAEREEMVDFSLPYYTSAMAVLTTQSVVDAGLEPNVESLQGAVWGAHSTTTALPMLNEIVQPERDPLLYGDNVDVTAAMQAGQIDAALFDLPTALYLAAVVVNDGVILGQFAADRSENPDQFGLLMEEGNPLKECVDAAIVELTESGALAAIEAQWLQEATGVPVIE
ncbi:MAG: amino acid ABC transporter substrate-binding protein [Rhizobiales bacterium]|nr:amino acid ABC transporter substrate-binding protein [Hyphomicrobiales bacterium]MBO6697515.1 amino acid ABC transporter substrate-binding protein [Hyphomicrobiales bacterium]MBO6736230.1 amino acid ABC transporter substrate-binding protein [Hyphomicrobiales bacterium]MBO6912700.1 amino acid ABC transporter substrate-binding protein [Hyphomicrobiales bacterium]MBO6953869.1 amino acid ABC transporter substrate-binding protein [Hyphomicrobiales bacterium]